MSIRSLAKALTLLAMIVPVLGLGACNTVEGFGKDLKSGGAALEDAAVRKK